MVPAARIGGLVLDPPLLNGSGVVDVVSSDDAWNVADATIARLGAFTTKSITRLPRGGSPQPWAEALDEGSLVNAAGLPNPGIEVAVVAWDELPARLGVPIIASIGGPPSDLPELAARIEAAGWASAIECNLSCPNVHGGLVGADPGATATVLASVRARTGLPLLAKLTPACGAPGEVARAAVDAGADALTCCNTMPIRAIGGDGVPLLGAGPDGGMSGRALHPLALRFVAEARAAAPDTTIVGLGGIDGIDASRRMVDAGADVLGIGTGLVFDPTLAERLATWLRGA